MNRVLVFCSNPVNGGTAEIFSAMCTEILSMENSGVEVIPCVNWKNPVQVYDSVPGIVRLEVFSEEQTLGKLPTNVSFFTRVKNRIIRNYKYSGQVKRNKEIMKEYLIQNQINTVMIHNGGYVGDDLCNQMLQAASEVRVENRIMIFHSDFRKSILRKSLWRKYDKAINSCSTQTVTVSEFTKNRMLSSSYLRKDMKVIYNGITFEDSETIETKQRKVGFKKEAVHIGMVGNFLDNKGQLDMLKAVKQIKDNLKQPIQVILIGTVYDENYYKQCMEYITEHKMEDMISICHGIYNAKEYFCLFDVTVVPSLYDESFGLICVESMRAGVPVVAYACGGIPEVVQDGKNGYVIEVGNVQEMGKAILKLINNPEHAKRMGEHAKVRYETLFTRTVMGEKYLELLR